MSVPDAPDSRRRRWRRLSLFCLVLVVSSGTLAQVPERRPPEAAPSASGEPITPIPQPPAVDPRKLTLGERLFMDRALSLDGTLSCMSCHDVRKNGADDGGKTMAEDGSEQAFRVLTVFNAALNFRFNWEGNQRTLELETRSSLQNRMATSVDEAIGKLTADPAMARLFEEAYGRPADAASLLDAIVAYERSLLTPGSRFDKWLRGDKTALTAEELSGYGLFKSIGCISCHQGVNVGGNLYERYGIFHPLASPNPGILRVPSLRNIATTAPYFHDGSSPDLEDAVRKMARAQLDRRLSDQQLHEIVAFLDTLTGDYRGRPVTAP